MTRASDRRAGHVLVIGKRGIIAHGESGRLHINSCRMGDQRSGAKRR